VNRSTKPAVQAINSVPQSITQDLNALNIREPTKPAFISSQPPSTPAFQPPKFQSPQLQPTDGDSSDIFTAVYMPNTRMNTFQSPLMQDGSKKVLDPYTGVFKYQEGFANETPDQAGKKEIRVRGQPVTPSMPPTVDYSTKPRPSENNNKNSEAAAFRANTNLKRTMSIPNIASHLNEEFVPSESSESGRVCLCGNLRIGLIRLMSDNFD